jgi:very-short-patch-repair endonuclease
MSINKKKELVEIAKEICRNLRRNSTPAEKKLWNSLRNRQLDMKKFLRQHPLFYDVTGKETFFVADFYCHEEKLVIELDGVYHKYRLTDDQNRTQIINTLGLTVIRFNNEEVINNLPYVLQKISDHFSQRI